MAEVQEGILNSSKNYKYQLFLDELLAHLQDATPKSILDKLNEPDNEIILTRSYADKYLSAIEGFRKNAIAITNSIEETYAKKQEFEKNQDTESASYFEIKAKYDELQKERDENFEKWQNFCEENEASYDDYINLVMAKSALIDYLKS